MFKYIFSIFFIYFFFGLLIFIFQRKILFNVSGRPNSPEYYGLSDIQVVSISTYDSVKLLAWFHKPKLNNPILIYFHGNSYDIGERSYRIKRYIDNGWGVLLLSWRGYSGNLGKPTEKNLYIDGKSAVQWIKQNTKYSYNNIVIYGESLGAAVAVELGSRARYKSIILEAPFKSIYHIAKKRYFAYPTKYLILDKFDNLSKIHMIKSPLLIINGKKDEITPYQHGAELYNNAKEPKKYLCIDEAMHNNLYDFNIDKDVINFSLKIWK